MEFSEIIKSPEVIWFIAGLLLLGIELFGGMGLIIGFFGVGAWITSFACMLTEDLEVKYQFLIFSVTSLITLILLRRMIKRKLFDQPEISEENTSSHELKEEFIGQTVIAETDFGPGKVGKVTFKGAAWDAFSTSEVKEGEVLQIKDIKSIKLIVEPIPTEQ